MAEGTDRWRRFRGIQGDDQQASGMVEPVTGLEDSPCFTCRSFEKNEKRLRQHIASKKNVEILADGTVRSLIDRDFKDRETITFNVRDFGWCRLWTIPVDQLATCENWGPTRSVSDLMRKFPKNTAR